MTADDPHKSDAEEVLPLETMRIVLELEIPSDVLYIESVVGVVSRQCAEFRFAPRHCALNVPVALTEALSNAILRGNREDTAKCVRLSARVDSHSLILEVTDEGSGFNLDDCTIDPTEPGSLEREDGRGLFLMRKLMDRVERFAEKGNVVRLTLFR
jgi:serine/threonine-protein kinase RsbW